MATICVEIEIDTETGNLTVAECPPGEEKMAGEEGNEPAGQSFTNIDEAMKAVAAILTQGQQTPDQVRQSVMTGYKKAGNRPMMGM